MIGAGVVMRGRFGVAQTIAAKPEEKYEDGAEGWAKSGSRGWQTADGDR